MFLGRSSVAIIDVLLFGVFTRAAAYVHRAQVARYVRDFVVRPRLADQGRRHKHEVGGALTQTHRMHSDATRQHSRLLLPPTHPHTHPLPALSPQPIPGFPPLPILLTNTLVPKNTRALVAGVRRLLESHGAPTSATFDAIGAIASEFLERAAASVSVPTVDGVAEGAGVGDGAAESPEAGPFPLTAECVGELAQMNHRLLCALGVGHPALERVCEVAGRHGCSSKLTGAGECVARLFSLGKERDSAESFGDTRDVAREGAPSVLLALFLEESTAW